MTLRDMTCQTSPHTHKPRTYRVILLPTAHSALCIVRRLRGPEPIERTLGAMRSGGVSRDTAHANSECGNTELSSSLRSEYACRRNHRQNCGRSTCAGGMRGLGKGSSQSKRSLGEFGACIHAAHIESGELEGYRLK